MYKNAPLYLSTFFPYKKTMYVECKKTGAVFNLISFRLGPFWEFLYWTKQSPHRKHSATLQGWCQHSWVWKTYTDVSYPLRLLLPAFFGVFDFFSLSLCTQGGSDFSTCVYRVLASMEFRVQNMVSLRCRHHAFNAACY